MPPVIDPKLCNGCLTCYRMCPQDVFAFSRGKMKIPQVAYPQECWYCGACVVDCPREAIRLKLPLPLHIVPSPALFGAPESEDEQALRRAADFSRSIERAARREDRS